MDDSGVRFGADPGLCGLCRHAKTTATRRGTAYLRCTRAAWDERLVRYPPLPVRSCVGFAPTQDRRD
jgi:propionyl-CoA synthetase